MMRNILRSLLPLLFFPLILAPNDSAAEFLFWGNDKDTDLDGVSDKTDGCPGTAAGVVTDGRGCPQDSDQDGIPDGTDGCPATTAGVMVDGRGCPQDSDQDGVPDDRDACPGSPSGVRTDDAGCPEDTDRDGVPEGQDMCPYTPKGVRVDGRGCPGDTDRDGIADTRDQCPGTPPGTKVNASGCPPSPLGANVGDVSTLDIRFAANSARIRPKSYPLLDEVAEYLKRNPRMKVEIDGHTDSEGPARINRKISQERATAVKAYLVSKGVSQSRLTAKGYGESMPLATNKTPQGRSMNRRIEFKILSK